MNMKIKHLLIFAMLIFSCSVLKSQDSYLKKIDKSYNDFGTAYNYLLDFYIVNLDPEELMNSAILGMLGSLDPYSELLNDAEMESFHSLENNYFTGIGILTEQRKDGITIMDILEDSPASKSGLKVGDIFNKIDNISCEGFNSDSLRKYLRGMSGTSVQIEIKRPIKETLLEFIVERTEIPQHSVNHCQLIDDTTVYLQIVDFSTNTKGEAVEALTKIQKESKGGIKSIIIDLRNNGGGIMLSSLDLFEIFMQPKTLFGSINNKSGLSKEFFTKNSPLFPDAKVAILVNNQSASASEFFAAAMQDYDRAVIIGKKTYGKGISQIIKDLPSGKSLKITIEEFHTPKNRIINQVNYIPKYMSKSINNSDSIVYSENGRPLKNHSAVLPDIEAEEKKYPAIVYELEDKKVFFDFATILAADIETLPADFAINDEIYNSFKNYYLSKDSLLGSKSVSVFNNYKNSLVQDSIDTGVINEFEKFIRLYTESLKNDLDRFKSIISEILYNELASRYLTYSQMAGQFLKNDNYIQAAIDALNNKYSEILKIKK